MLPIQSYIGHFIYMEHSTRKNIEYLLLAKINRKMLIRF